MSETSTTLLSKPSKKLLILTFLMYCTPFIFFSIGISNFDFVRDVGEKQRLLFNPYSIGFLIFSGTVLVVGNIAFFRKIMNYDGTEASYKKCRKLVNTAGVVNITFIVYNAISLPVVMGIPYWYMYREFDLISLFMDSFFSFFLVGTFQFYLWLINFEKWASVIPIHHQDVRFSFRKRMVIALVFILGGFFSGVIMPFYSYRNQILSGEMTILEVCNKKLITVLVIGMGFSVATFAYVIGHFMKKIKSTCRLSRSLAEGDFTEINMECDSADEFGLLSLYLNRFHENTRNIMSDVKKNVSESKTNAQELTSKMGDAVASVDQIVGNISQVKEEMTRQSESVDGAALAANEILQNIQHLNDSVENQSANVTESSAAVRQMVANIDSVTHILGKNAIAVQQLTAAADEGQKSVVNNVQLSKQIYEESQSLLEASSVIQNIAEQTNLLAMNAAIEAAHAGEAGKGFSVVASEIRKLAEQSNAQGKKITEQLQKLKTAIASVSDSSEDLRAKFDEIHELTNTVQEQENVVVSAMDEQNQGSKQVLEAMRNIDDSTIEVREGSKEILQDGQKIVQEMDGIGKGALLITDTVSEMTKGTEIIAGAIHDVEQSSNRNAVTIDSLERQVEHFKL